MASFGYHVDDKTHDVRDPPIGNKGAILIEIRTGRIYTFFEDNRPIDTNGSKIS